MYTVKKYYVRLQLLVTANVPGSPILGNLMTVAISSSKTSILTRATQHNIPEEGILHGSRKFFLNTGNDSSDYVAIYPRRLNAVRTSNPIMFTPDSYNKSE
jgi:hypothetical protein